VYNDICAKVSNYRAKSQHLSAKITQKSVSETALRPRFSKNNHFPQKQAAAKVYHCYAIFTLFAEFRL
jgi:DNA/RNA-binding domain of Phe-tRNA-synthetase-like protein